MESVYVALIGSITTLCGIYLKDRFLHRDKKKSHTISSIDKSMFYLEMDKICATIRKTLNADGAYMAYFHNGGYFANGVSMDKFSVVGADYNSLLKNPDYKKNYTNCLINYMSYAYHRLLVDSRFASEDIDTMIDLSYKTDLNKRSVKSVYSFIIKDPLDDKPIGFISIEYLHSKQMSLMEETEIWKRQNNLCRLLNMTVLDNE